MFTRDESNLERFIGVPIVLPPLIGEKWRSYFDDILRAALEGTDDFYRHTYESELADMQKHFPWLELCDLIEPVLDTPRKLKLMGRHLQVKLKTPARNLFLFDLILLSAIQASNLRMFEWVSRSRAWLIAPGSAGMEGWFLDHFRDKRAGIRGRQDDPDLRTKKINEAMEQEGLNENEKRIITTLFLEKHPYRDHPPIGGKKDRGVRRDPYFLNYFVRDKIPFIETVYGGHILRECAEDSVNPGQKVYDLANRDWEGDQRHDVRTIIIECLRVGVFEFEGEAAFSCLTALGKLAKKMSDGFGFSHKRYAANTIWLYIHEKKIEGEAAKNVILRVLNSDVSHEMYTAIVFYLFVDDEERREKIVDFDAFLEDIKKAFDTRCKEIFYAENESPRDLLDDAVTDDPTGMLFRWAQVQNRFNHSRYIVDFIRAFPHRAPAFIAEVRKGSHDQKTIEVLMPREYWAVFTEDPVRNSLSENEAKFIQRVLAGNYLGGMLSGRFED